MGLTKDRQGRDGIAIATTTALGGFSEQRVLLFDRDTGAMLAYELVALTDSAELDLEALATFGYTMWQDRRYLDDIP